MNKPLVSIIIPAYNCQSTIERAIESCSNQTYRNYEVIIVDDGSSDGTLSLLKVIASQYSFLKIYSQPNGGVSSARNIGLRKSTGDYVQFLDSDDWLEENAIERCINIMLTNEDISFIQFGLRIWEEDRILREPNPGNAIFKSTDSWISFQPIYKLLNAVYSKFYTRKWIEREFNTNIFRGEDLLFNIENFDEKTKVIAIPDVLYNVQRQNENSLNKLYKKGALLGYTKVREATEKKMTLLFQEQFDCNIYRRNEISSIVALVAQLCGGVISGSAI